MFHSIGCQTGCIDSYELYCSISIVCCVLIKQGFFFCKVVGVYLLVRDSSRCVILVMLFFNKAQMMICKLYSFYCIQTKEALD